MFLFSARKQRGSRRHWVTVPVLIRNGELSVEGISINISDGGIYLFAATNLSVGAQIDIEFPSANKTEFVCARGIVRRRALYLYGIEFIGNDAAACLPEITQADDGISSLSA